jgi:hypothetical protein
MALAPGSGSWPLRRVGHGTPIDGGRRSAWAGNGSARSEDADEVSEDGVLFLTVRFTSIDSAPQPSQRSISLHAECNYVSPAPPPLAYKLSTEHRRSTLSLLLLPESVKIQLPGNQPQNQPQLVHGVGVDHAEGARLAHLHHSIDVDARAVVRDALRVGDAVCGGAAYAGRAQRAHRRAAGGARARDGFGARVPARSGRPGAEPRRNDLVRRRYTPWLGTRLALGVLLRPTLDSATLAPAIRRPASRCRSASNRVSGGSASWAGCCASGICCVDAKLRLSYVAVNYISFLCMIYQRSLRSTILIYPFNRDVAFTNI